MEHALTDMQMTFYPKGLPQEDIMWNQGLRVLFAQAYPFHTLNRMLNCLTEQFDQLRLQITKGGGVPTAQIRPFQPAEYPVFSFSSREELSQAAQAFVNEPMDVVGPLFRCAIFQMCGQSGVLICAHHILIDGYSAQVMVSFMERFLKGSGETQEPGQSYEDYLEAISRYPGSKRSLRDRQYWQAQFARKPECAVFSGGSALPDYSSSEWETTVPPEVFRRIEQFCAQQGVSVSTFFCTALGAYIHREKDCSDFTIGVPVLNRTTRAELNSIGLYMHILPLVVSLTAGSFRENVQETEYTKMDLFRHQKMTQTQILSLIQQERGEVSSLFDVIFDYQAFAESEYSELRFHYSNALSVPLEIHLHSLGRDLHRVKLRYRVSMFEREQVMDLWDRVMNIVRYVLEHPDVPVRRIPQYAMPQEERDKLLYQWNDTAFAYAVPETTTVSSLFEAAARECAHRTCIRVGDTAVSYGDFLTAVQALDGKIRALTMGKKAVVAILAERSVEMYAAIYAAVRGGNAYLPVSPDDPAERIEYVLRDSGAALVLAQGKFCGKAVGCPCMDVTEFLRNPVVEDSVPPVAAGPEDTAYVIYTSGSTGRPKGARISHRALLNRILWMQEKYPLGENGVILQKTPYTFDVSLWEIFWWGICGKTMAASSPGEHFLPARILEAVNRYRITHLHFVPAVLELFVTYLENSGYSCSSDCPLEHAFSSGEELKAGLVRRFYRLFPYPKVRLHNLYGPTECAVDVSYYDCLPTDTDPVPIGRPIYNTQLYVLDSVLEPVPTGVRGQLCIGGRNVGQGYLNRPELTAEKYVPNPFGEGKLYLTGDYARFTPDGQIIFCGRMDGQIKLNGQRIEIGEIEAVIRNVEGVEGAAVTAYRHNGQTRLAAVYCGEKAGETEIREQCTKHLPPYMVPPVWIRVPALPISKSGKLDRKTLTALAESHVAVGSWEPPLTEKERMIADIFSRILRVERTGRRDSFFELGGSSLSMIHALSEPELEGITAPVFMENPTPEKLARQLEQPEKRENTWIHRLRQGTSREKNLVLIPYAGGSAEAFARLADAADQFWPEISLYCMDYPHSMGDCLRAAEELDELSKTAQLYLYSHCAGSAAALQLLNILEERDECAVKHYIAGASIPPAAPQRENIWSGVSDELLEQVLVKAGASFETLSQRHIADMLGRFRRDTDFWTAYFAGTPVKVACPVTPVLSKADLFTENYADAEKLWSRHAECVTAVRFVDTASHYFQSAQAETLLRILRQIINGENT